MINEQVLLTTLADFKQRIDQLEAGGMKHAAGRWANYLPLAGGTLTGDLNIGANAINTTNVCFYEVSANRIGLRSIGGGAPTLNLLAGDITFSSLIEDAATGEIDTKNENGASLSLRARITGGAMTEVARWIGAAEPHIIFTTGALWTERAAQLATAAGFGSFWVRNDAPCQPMFTDDDGDDRELKREKEVAEAQFTANQNDLAIDTSASFIRMSADAARDLTGIVAGIPAKTIYLTNIAANAITVKHQDANSAAANRFLSTTGADLVLAQDDLIFCIYDATTQRWRCSLLP